MANVLSDTKRQQVLALGRLGWPLRRIEETTGVRREPASAYLKGAGIAIRPPGGWGWRPVPKTGQGLRPGPLAARGRSGGGGGCSEPWHAARSTIYGSAA